MNRLGVNISQLYSSVSPLAIQGYWKNKERIAKILEEKETKTIH